MLALLLAAVVGVAGSVGVLRAADEKENKVERVEGVDDYLSANDGPAENFLLVGSDSREGVGESDADAGAIGDVAGRRSDTIMILRREKNGGAALVSLPRDLWVTIPGKGDGKINSAYNEGPQTLIQTIQESLGVPIQHYVEVDLVGFKRLVDAMGGVTLTFEYATKDDHSGLDVQPGTHKLDGTMALAYARSRYYEEFRDGDWQEDPRADLGRIERQQQFIRAAVNQALHEMTSNPYSASRLIDAAISALRLSPSIDPLDAAKALRAAAEEGLRTLTLPVYGDTVGDQSVVQLGDGAETVLEYFRGNGQLPPPDTTAAPADDE